MKKKVALLMWMLCWVTASAFAYEGEPFYYARQWRRDIVLYAQPSLDSQILGTYPLYTVSFDIDAERWELEWILQEFWDEALAELPEMDDAIDRFLLRRWQGKVPDEKEVKRTVDALIRRGHSWKDIQSGLRRYRVGLELEEITEDDIS